MCHAERKKIHWPNCTYMTSGEMYEEQAESIYGRDESKCILAGKPLDYLQSLQWLMAIKWDFDW